MSSATTITPAATATAAQPRRRQIFWRFVWKELRMVRGFWLAIAVLALLVQGTQRMLLPFDQIAASLFATAIAAAVLFTAGAAATIFAVELEEETYNFLSSMPTRWQPIFAAKVAMVLITAIALALVLSMVGFLDYRKFDAVDAGEILGVLAPAILEALAWGTLFSLLVKRPLVAAILTLVTGAVAVNVIVSMSSGSDYGVASLQPHAYIAVLPLRLGIATLILVVDAFIARRWLIADAHPASPLTFAESKHGQAFLHRASTWLGLRRAATHPGTRRRILARLLWQTWRESWKLLLLPLAVAILPPLVMAIVAGIVHSDNEVAPFIALCSPMIIPALYGALAFHSDQRRRSYQFLAEHAARPRYVWFAREVVWLAAWLAVGTVLLFLCASFVGARIRNGAWEYFEQSVRWGSQDDPRGNQIIYDIAFGTAAVARLLTLASFGSLVAYSVGQLASMILRSEILAAFLAMALAFVVSAWVAVLFAWQLSGWLFMLLLFASLMLATWLRAPDWIRGRNTPRAWLKPALAVIVPLALIGGLVPYVRLRQLPATIISFTDDEGRKQLVDANAESKKELQLLTNQNTPAARETARQYMRLAEGSNPENDLLKRWEQPEYADAGPEASPFGIDESKIPANERDAFNKAKHQQLKLVEQNRARELKEAMALSKRPACHFDFDARSIARLPKRTNNLQPVGLAAYRTYQNLNDMVRRVANESITDDDKPIERWLAALRISEHIRSGQPSVIYIDQLTTEETILRDIGDWALEKKRTKEELRDALTKLTAAFESESVPVDALLADDILVRNVIDGKDLPLILSGENVFAHNYLAWLANDLPWERQRAIRALDHITLRNVHELRQLAQRAANQKPREFGLAQSRWVRSTYGGTPELWEIDETAATTSYLASLEYKARLSTPEFNRAYVDHIVRRRGALLRIALAAYRLDNQKYPAYLAYLVPAHLKKLPIDPYSNQAFVYEPEGLSLPLEHSTAEPGLDRVYGYLEPHTPVFWSVGASNARLKQIDRNQFDPADPDNPEGEAKQTSTPFYFLWPDETGWLSDFPAVFPLAK